MPKLFQCRFCLENDEKQNLLTPCLCKGSSKYVHNRCLVTWYIQEPIRGALCAVCTYRYSMKPLRRLEVWQPVSLFTHIHLYYPFPTILFTHWLFMFSLSCIQSTITIDVYTLYQLVWHLIMVSSYMHMVYRVENRLEYALHWTREMRPLLPVMHTYFLCILPKVSILGGIAADMCMIYYFYEHYRILNLINQNRRVEFLSRV